MERRDQAERSAEESGEPSVEPVGDEIHQSDRQASGEGRHETQRPRRLAEPGEARVESVEEEGRVMVRLKELEGEDWAAPAAQQRLDRTQHKA